MGPDRLDLRGLRMSVNIKLSQQRLDWIVFGSVRGGGCHVGLLKSVQILYTAHLLNELLDGIYRSRMRGRGRMHRRRQVVFSLRFCLLIKRPIVFIK